MTLTLPETEGTMARLEELGDIGGSIATAKIDIEYSVSCRDPNPRGGTLDLTRRLCATRCSPTIPLHAL